MAWRLWKPRKNSRGLKWGVFEGGESVEVAPAAVLESMDVAPCNGEGVILPPHVLGQYCLCRPRILVARDSKRVILVHEMFQ